MSRAKVTVPTERAHVMTWCDTNFKLLSVGRHVWSLPSLIVPLLLGSARFGSPKHTRTRPSFVSLAAWPQPTRTGHASMIGLTTQALRIGPTRLADIHWSRPVAADHGRWARHACCGSGREHGIRVYWSESGAIVRRTQKLRFTTQ